MNFIPHYICKICAKSRPVNRDYECNDCSSLNAYPGNPFLKIVKRKGYSPIVYTFKVGDKVRYKDYHNIKGVITKVTPGTGILINDTLIASPDALELDENVFIDNQPYLYADTPADTKYTCTCSLRDLMMKGCTKHK